MDQITQEVNATSYLSWVGGSNNFRKEIDPEYKAHRSKIKPIHLNACIENLIKNWDTKVTDGCETDDMLSLHQSTMKDTIVCSLDKDLLQVPGRHYQWSISGRTKDGSIWTKDALWYDITPEEGLRNFYKGLIIGDTSDNIKGVEGLGKVKAEKALVNVEPFWYHHLVKELYNEDERFYRNLQLMWLWREPEGTWTIDRERGTLLQGALPNEGQDQEDIRCEEGGELL